MREVKKKQNNQKGFTLIELVLVISLGAMIMVAAMALYGKARDSAVTEKFGRELHTIMAGLSELKMYKGTLPAGSTWPSGLDPYVSTELQSEYDYDCTSGVITITTPDTDDASQGSRMMQKLVDQGLCDSSSTLSGNKVQCVLSSFNGNAGC